MSDPVINPDDELNLESKEIVPEELDTSQIEPRSIYQFTLPPPEGIMYFPADKWKELNDFERKLVWDLAAMNRSELYLSNKRERDDEEECEEHSEKKTNKLD